MKIIPVFSLVLLFVANSLLAQSQRTGTHENYSFPAADSSKYHTMLSDSAAVDRPFKHLTINSDSRIYDLMDIQAEKIQRLGGINGYRVQIYQGSKDRAYQLKSNFLKKYPGYEVYVKFQTPDFRVRIGDFRYRSEALKLKYLIEKDFPNPYLVDDVINFPDLKDGGEE